MESGMHQGQRARRAAVAACLDLELSSGTVSVYLHVNVDYV